MTKEPRQATIEDLLLCRRAAVANGHLEHQVCGGKVYWSLLSDKAKCGYCGAGWLYSELIYRSQQKLYKWEPPVNVYT